MIRNISIGIDVGTSATRVVVGEFLKGEKYPKIIGVGESETKGMRHGYIVHGEETVLSIKQAVSLAEKSSGLKIKRAFVAVGGVTLRGDVATGTSIISKADGEVTALDLEKAMEDAEANLNLENKKIIQSFPVSYRLDGKEVLGRPLSMHGTKLEIKAIFVTCSAAHLDDLLESLALTGVEVIDITAAPIAAARIVLSPKQKIVGGALVDIGAETTSLAVYENSTLISLHTFGLGGADITNDIALGLRIPLERAENLKLQNKEEYPDAKSGKKLEEIVGARLQDIFELINNHFKKIKRSELLPAGIVLSGGGSSLPGILELSKEALNLPVQLAKSEMFGNVKTKLRDSVWFTALGLLAGKEEESHSYGKPWGGLIKNLKNIIKSSLKQMMP